MNNCLNTNDLRTIERALGMIWTGGAVEDSGKREQMMMDAVEMIDDVLAKAENRANKTYNTDEEVRERLPMEARDIFDEVLANLRAHMGK
jgi:hypothetical protein